MDSKSATYKNKLASLSLINSTSAINPSVDELGRIYNAHKATIMAQHEKGALAFRTMSNHEQEIQVYNDRAITGDLRTTNTSIGSGENNRVIFSTTLIPSSISNNIAPLFPRFEILVGLDVERCNIRDADRNDLYSDVKKNKHGRTSYAHNADLSVLIQKPHDLHELLSSFLPEKDGQIDQSNSKGLYEVTLKIFSDSVLCIADTSKMLDLAPRGTLKKLIETQLHYRETLGFNVPIVIYANGENSVILSQLFEISSQANKCYIIPDNILPTIAKAFSINSYTPIDQFLQEETLKRMEYADTIREILPCLPSFTTKKHKAEHERSKLIDQYDEISASNHETHLAFRLSQYLRLIENNSLTLNHFALSRDISEAQQYLPQPSTPKL